jgi:multiple sugar transport system ATP-binding protein
MNFLPAEITAGGLETVIGRIPLSDRVRSALERHDAPRQVIMGVRPEAFGDAQLVRGRNPEGRDCTFSGTVEILESLGAEKFAYIDLGSAGAIDSEHLAEAYQGNVDHGRVQLVARLDARSRAREGESVELDFDPNDILLFEPDSGLNLTEEV